MWGGMNRQSDTRQGGADTCKRGKKRRDILRDEEIPARHFRGFDFGDRPSNPSSRTRSCFCDASGGLWTVTRGNVLQDGVFRKGLGACSITSSKASSRSRERRSTTSCARFPSPRFCCWASFDARLLVWGPLGLRCQFREVYHAPIDQRPTLVSVLSVS